MAAAIPAVVPGRSRTSRYRRYAAPQMTERFVGATQVIALCAAMLVLALLLFPKAFIRQQLRAGGAPNAATISYLELLLRAQPGDQTTRLQLVRERLRAGQLDLAERELAPLAQQSGEQNAEIATLWLNLRRAQFVALAPGSPERQPEHSGYAAALRHFGQQLSPADELAETRKATAAGLYVSAAQLAWHLLASTDAQAAALHSSRSTARAAGASYRATHGIERGLTRMIGLVWSSRSAGRDLADRQPTGNLRDLRTQAFQALLESHLAAGRPLDALHAAQAALPSLDPTQVDWAQLIRVAVWAEQPQAAADFARRWLASAADDNARWTAFHAMIDAYLAADQPRLALDAARASLGTMPKGPPLWRLMTRLAMQAGNTGESAVYARRLVQLDTAHAQ